MRKIRQGRRSVKSEPNPVTNNDGLRTIEVQAMLNSLLLSRSKAAGRLGKSFGGKRDLYATLGYPETPTYDDFYGIYSRDGLGTRIVDTVSDETWREPPFLLLPGQEADNARENPSELQKQFQDLADNLSLWQIFSDVDAACGCSRFALIFMGLPGKMDEPAVSGPISYLSVFDEGNAEVNNLDLDLNPESPRYGMPNYYKLSFLEGNDRSVSQRVHWTRVIHVREGRSRSRIYGIPRLKGMLNRLLDLEKVVGSSSEAFWLMIYKGLAFTADEGFDMAEVGTPEYKAQVDEIDEYIHGLRRYMRLIGTKVQDLGGNPVDGSLQFGMITDYLAGSSHIPKRIMLGSERGELASTQDGANFADFIRARQTRFAESSILRPFIQRCGNLKIMDVPPKFFVEWPSLFSLTEGEQSTIAVNVASAILSVSGGAPETVMPPQVFAKRYLKYTPTPDEEAQMMGDIDNSSSGQPDSQPNASEQPLTIDPQAQNE